MLQSQKRCATVGWGFQDSTSIPFVSVIVPVRNEALFIAETLRQLLEQQYDPNCFEVIVADGGSTDRTRDLVRAMQTRYPNLHLLANPGVWSSAGRNAALEIARGDLIVLVDGHCDVENPRYLADVVEAFDRSGADCIGRPQPLDVSLATPVQKAIATARGSRLGHHPDSHIYSNEEAFVPPQSVAVAYRREIFDQVGTFDENFDACEDVEFNHRVAQAGLTCFFTPQVALRYHPRATLAGLFRQMIRYGRGRVRLLRKHPETFTLLGFLPALFVIGLLLGPVLAMISPWLGTAYYAGVGCYSAIIGVTSITLSMKLKQLGGLLLFPLVFVAIHVGAGTGILLETFAPEKRPSLLERESTVLDQINRQRAA